MSSDLIIRFLSDVAYARSVFFRDARNSVDIRSFLTNEANMLRLAQGTIASSLTTLLLTSTTVPSFFDPVVVALTSQQIENATRTIEVPENSQDICCICQESLRSFASCEVRSCNHKLHRSCASQWFSMSVRCPVCRADLREQQENTNNNGRT